MNPNGQLPAVSGLTDQQIRMAAIIIQTGQKLKVPARGWVVGVATALQESRLTNLPFLGANNDHDSIGLFQQRPSAGWGTVEQLSDPAYQARKFFEKRAVALWKRLEKLIAPIGPRPRKVSAVLELEGKYRIQVTASQTLELDIRPQYLGRADPLIPSCRCCLSARSVAGSSLCLAEAADRRCSGVASAGDRVACGAAIDELA